MPCAGESFVSSIRYEEDVDIGRLILNRPHAKNAFDGPMMDELRAAVEALEPREDLRALIITGAGSESFCAGGDLKWLQRLNRPEKGQAMGRRMQETIDRISCLPML